MSGVDKKGAWGREGGARGKALRFKPGADWKQMFTQLISHFNFWDWTRPTTPARPPGSGPQPGWHRWTQAELWTPFTGSSISRWLPAKEASFGQTNQTSPNDSPQCFSPFSVGFLTLLWLQPIPPPPRSSAAGFSPVLCPASPDLLTFKLKRKKTWTQRGRR